MLNDDKILFVTPALPGFYVLTPCFDEAGAICEASREPVIAWALDELGCTWPVTVREVLNGEDPAILCPDGQVLNFGSEWDSLPDWLNYRKATVQHDDLC
ncbi:hypothetical protein [Thauera sinica]|uniref:Uncharacterized protein n=1 Tax=Thauera sinica TaxID=2665146 RepID=A0ABW1ATM1_9RHOO|nr:hypothetical protein [Thauera sp. K11]ATE61939.1 hypothetical protein CCZ27_19965 [Thauera sp. K11]